MIQGLNAIPKPFIKKVTIEKAQANFQSPKHFINKGDYGADAELYADISPQYDPGDHAIKLVFELGIMLQPTNVSHLKDKSAEEQALGLTDYFTKEVKNVLSNFLLVGKKFTTKDSFEKFLTSTSKEKADMLLLSRETPVGLSIFPGFELDNYLFKDANGRFYLEIPAEFMGHWNISKSYDANPSFLAYAFALKMASTIPWSAITSEIIFDGGAIPAETGYFTIANTYSFNGSDHPAGDNKINDSLGRVYGKFQDVWVGNYHLQPTFPGSTQYRPMASFTGGHTQDVHPYLDFKIVENTKIIDARAPIAIEKIFKHGSFQEILASASSLAPPIFTGGKEKNTIDEMVPNKGIVSEACFSLVPQKINNVTNLFFAIDKMKLLKETTQLPGLLDRLIMANPLFGDILVRNLNIFHFEISKTNTQTGVKFDLLTGDNDKSFNDLGATNYLGNNISKGYIFKQKTKDVLINNKRNIALYEFTEGSIDKYDLGTYFYEIKLKFRDPMIQYLAMRLAQLRQVIKDLDELQTKTTLKMYDSSGNRGRFVDVFDKYQNKLNATFVKEALNPPSPQPPQITFTYPFVNELPSTLNTAFPAIKSEDFLAMDNLNALLLGLNSYDGLEPVLEFATESGTATKKLEDLIAYIRNSLVLPSTSPSRIGRIRSLLFLLESRITDSLKLYTTEKITKQDVGFTSADYEKSQGNTDNTTEYVVEYAHKFNKLLGLSKTINSFDWVGNVGEIPDVSFDPDYATIKTIAKVDYIKAIKSPASILTDQGKAEFASDTYFSYSFLPFSVFGDNLNLRNRIKAGWVTDPYWEIQKIEHLQTIRKELIDRVAGTPESVVTPEILAQFGVRFTTSLEESFDNLWFDGLSIPPKQLKIPDNFGEVFEAISKSKDTFRDGKQNNKFNNSFGSTEDPLYEWAGDSKEHYPKVLADSLVNLIFSDNIQHFRDLSFFNTTFLDQAANLADVFKNKDTPYMMNLFSHGKIAHNMENAKEYISAAVLESLFDESDGQLIINNYALYVALFGLFGKVYYLKEFDQRFADAKLTPSSFVDRNIVKAMNWTPVTREALAQITPQRSLFCKVELFENNGALDEQIIKLFQKYFNYNQYFYISSGTTLASPPVLTVKPKKLLGEGNTLLPADTKIGPLTKALSNDFFIKAAEETKSEKSIRTEQFLPGERESEFEKGPTKAEATKREATKRKGPTKRR